jgi:hypothetical protein
MEPESGGPWRAYKAYPSRRKVRWLFPADDPVMRRAGLKGFFEPSSLRGRILKGLVDSGALRGGKVWLQEGALASLEAALAQTLGEPQIRVAFYVGVPAPHRKATAQVLTPAGETLAYAKIATSALAQAAVEVEWRTLLQLSKSANLRGKVPEVLSWFEWRGGKVLFITSGPTRPGPRHLSREHVSFCESVFLSQAEENVFGESPMWARMSELWLRLKSGLPEPFHARLGLALEQLRSELGPVSLPLSLAHGDFAPWNTRLAPRSLFVFDWERAAEGVIPLYDIFNFQAFQAALYKRRSSLPDRRFLQTLLNVTWPEGQKYLPWLYLAYLVDVSLLYSEAQMLAPGVGEKGVWHWFLQQIKLFLEEGSPL